jgi:hypothetical protein
MAWTFLAAGLCFPAGDGKNNKARQGLVVFFFLLFTVVSLPFWTM